MMISAVEGGPVYVRVRSPACRNDDLGTGRTPVYAASVDDRERVKRNDGHGSTEERLEIRNE